MATPTATAAAGPRWRRIAEALRAQIDSGLLPPGTRLPNEAQLAGTFGVHRHTLRQAVQQLVRDGLVQVRQGAGSFVRAAPLHYPLRLRTRLAEGLSGARRELLAHGEQAAGEWADWLGCSAQTPVVWMRHRAWVQAEVIACGLSLAPWPRLAGLPQAVARLGSVSLALAELGVADYTRARSLVAARLPDAHEAAWLQRPASQPVLAVRYLNQDGEGQPVEVGCTLFASDAVQLLVEPGA